jgi:plastocyanin
MKYSPAELTIARGDSVEWINQDLVPHTVTDEQVDSGLLSAGADWTRTFETQGDYNYRCLVHPEMRGSIHVKP